MGLNSHRPSHVPEINGNLNIIPQDLPKHKQFDLNPASTVLFNPIQNTTPSSCLTTLDSCPITNESATCSILTSNYPNIPPSSPSLINQSSASSTPTTCSEILNGLNYQILNTYIASYLPSIDYGSTNCYIISDGVWNGDEIFTQQEMDLDQNLSQFTDVMDLPNLMINPGNELRYGSECLGYQPCSQLSQFDQQQRMGLMLDSNFPYYGNAIIGSGFAENAQIMDKGIQEGFFDIPAQTEQMYQGTADRDFERKQDRKFKNRESAARSRVKKQEHVNYLENKSCRLKKENDLLNKELEFLRSIPRTRRQLRRTSSSEFI